LKLRESKCTYRSVSTPIAQGLVEIINVKDTKMVLSPKAQGLVNNKQYSQTCMLKNCTQDRMSCGKGTKRTNSGAAAKKTKFSEETAVGVGFWRGRNWALHAGIVVGSACKGDRIETAGVRAVGGHWVVRQG